MNYEHIKIGSIFEDRDSRRAGRKILVLETNAFRELASVKTLDDHGQATGKTSTIRFRRLVSRHYRLVSTLEPLHA